MSTKRSGTASSRTASRYAGEHIAAEDGAVGAVGCSKTTSSIAGAGAGAMSTAALTGVLPRQQQQKGSGKGSDEGTHDGKGLRRLRSQANLGAAQRGAEAKV